ncbi:TIR domain-containing protein [Fontivita pretiosa]|uniref:TIR domain-containing protein n=1 Tax=Fontivita pretiosa TaxID=2989684 RepID=UPI003D17A7A4
MFLCTAAFTASERDAAVDHIRKTYGWTLELYGLERLRTMLTTTHRQLVARHPQIFCPPFFPVAGGLSLAYSPDHLVIDHVDADAALAHWLARRLTLAGYHVWCRGLAPLAGSSVTETVRGLLTNRAFRYICILSLESLADPDFTARRSIAQAVGSQRGEGLVLPALAKAIDSSSLDQETRRLTAAHFTQGWAAGLKEIEEVLAAANCPRKPDGARDLAIRSYFPPDIVLAEPEVLASNLFRVIEFPQAILRFYSNKPIADEASPDLSRWAYREISPTHVLSFHHPPIELARNLDIVPKGGAVWNTVSELDGVRIDHLIKELLKKALYAECRRRGLLYCEDRDLVYFPFGLLKNDNLSFRRLDGQATHFRVAGERTHGKGERAHKFRYHIAPVFVPKESAAGGYEIIVRIRLRLTDTEGKLFSGRTANARRKKICKSWWNEEWLARTMGVMQFLANGGDRIVIGNVNSEKIVVDSQSRTWQIPVRLNEEALADAIAIRQEEEAHLRDEEEDEDDND